MTVMTTQNIDPSIVCENRIRYLSSLGAEKLTTQLLADTEQALSQIPEHERRTSLVLQLLQACIARRDTKAVISTWRKMQMGKYPELRAVLKEYDVENYLKIKLFTFRIVTRLHASNKTQSPK